MTGPQRGLNSGATDSSPGAADPPGSPGDPGGAAAGSTGGMAQLARELATDEHDPDATAALAVCATGLARFPADPGLSRADAARAWRGLWARHVE